MAALAPSEFERAERCARAGSFAACGESPGEVYALLCGAVCEIKELTKKSAERLNAARKWKKKYLTLRESLIAICEQIKDAGITNSAALGCSRQPGPRSSDGRLADHLADVAAAAVSLYFEGKENAKNRFGKKSEKNRKPKSKDELLEKAMERSKQSLSKAAELAGGLQKETEGKTQEPGKAKDADKTGTPEGCDGKGATSNSSNSSNPSGGSAPAKPKGKKGNRRKNRQRQPEGGAPEKKKKKRDASSEPRIGSQSGAFKITGIIAPLAWGLRAYDPEDGAVKQMHRARSLLNVRKLLNISLTALNNAMTVTLELKRDDDRRIVINPASCSDLTVCRYGARSAAADAEEQRKEYGEFMKEDGAADQAPQGEDQDEDISSRWSVPKAEREAAARADKEPEEKKQALNFAGYSPMLTDNLIVYKDQLVYDPRKFAGKFRGLYECRGMYVGSSVSQGMTVSMLALYVKAQTSQSRVADVYADLKKSGLTRKQISKIINKTSRAFVYRIAEKMRGMMLKNCRSLQADGTPVLVRSLKDAPALPGEDGDDGSPPREAPPGGKKCYAVTLVSGPFEEYKGVCYLAGLSRRKEEVFRLLNLRPDGSGSEKLALRCLLTDCCDSYSSALKIINGKRKEAGLEPIAHANCLAHARRKFRDALSAMGKLGLYEKAADGGDGLFDFDDRLEKLSDEDPDMLWPSETVLDLMHLTLLTDILFWYERYARDRDMTEEELLAFRSEYSASAVAELFDRLHEIADSAKNGIRSSKKTGKYSPNHAIPWTASVVYALNAEDQLKTFLTHPEIRIDNNASELGCRQIVTQRKITLFSNSVAGYTAYTSLKTVSEMCRCNNVSLTSYLSWLIQNLKFRIDELRMKRGIPNQILRMPKNTKAAPDDLLYLDGEGDFSAWDDRLPFYDEVSIDGLTVWDYMALFLRNGVTAKELNGVN